MHPLNGKIFLNEKTSSLIWTKGAEMHTHFCGFQRKNFYLVKRSPHLFGIAKSNDTLFLRKNEKIFFQLRDSLLLLAPKVPSLIWNWNVKTQPVFWKKILKRLHVSKNLLTCSHWESVFGDGNSEKSQKNKLAGYGRHTFDTKNIINFLKYSERIDIG